MHTWRPHHGCMWKIWRNQSTTGFGQDFSFIWIFFCVSCRDNLPCRNDRKRRKQNKFYVEQGYSSWMARCLNACTVNHGVNDLGMAPHLDETRFEEGRGNDRHRLNYKYFKRYASLFDTSLNSIDIESLISICAGVFYFFCQRSFHFHS